MSAKLLVKTAVSSAILLKFVANDSSANIFPNAPSPLFILLVISARFLVIIAVLMLDVFSCRRISSI